MKYKNVIRAVILIALTLWLTAWECIVDIQEPDPESTPACVQAYDDLGDFYKCE